MNTSFWEKTVSKSICYGAYLATLSKFKRRRTRGTLKILIQAALQGVNFPFLRNGLRYFQSCKIDFGSQLDEQIPNLWVTRLIIIMGTGRLTSQHIELVCCKKWSLIEPIKTSTICQLRSYGQTNRSYHEIWYEGTFTKVELQICPYRTPLMRKLWNSQNFQLSNMLPQYYDGHTWNGTAYACWLVSHCWPAKKYSAKNTVYCL